jgi:hypothetical protein
MRKYLIGILLVTMLVVPTLAVKASTTMTMSQLVELLITVGAIAPDKIVAARALVTTTASVATSTSYIQVLTPNGGESWQIDLDVPYKITWGSSGLTQARIALVSSVSKTPVCDLNLTPIASKNGNHEYEILLKDTKCYNLTTGSSTKLVSGTYKARVYFTDSLGVTVKDESNATFRILPVAIPSIKVTYPNGGETLKRNDEYDVKYSFKNVTNVLDNMIYLYLLDNDGNIAYNSHKIKNKSGTYTLDLPGTLKAGAYKIKLKTTTSVDKIEIEDVSDNFFWISTGL